MKVRRLLTGKKFGRLTPTEYVGTDSFRNALWKCKCDCGNVVIEKGTLLTNGKVISCGECMNKYFKNLTKEQKEKMLENKVVPKKEEMERRKKKGRIYNEPITGKRFGRLTVLKEYKEEINGKMVNMAECQCDCGNIIKTRRQYLMTGTTRSCGCLKSEHFKGHLFKLNPEFIGKRIGRLTVESFDLEQRKWKCKCDCGNIVYVKRLNGNTKSCGCLKKSKTGTKRKEDN